MEININTYQTRKKYIMKKLFKHYAEFIKAYPNLKFFVLCLQGSQNYDLDIYNEEYQSDVDSKVIVIPSLEDLVYNRTPISTTYVTPNNEHIDIKDIRLMFDNFKKQNINFLEILFTDFVIVNPEYQEEWNYLTKYNELIAHYNINQALRCMVGMSMEKKKALCHPYPSLIDKIKKYGYDGKQLHHIMRMNNFIRAYISNKDYKSCLTFNPNKEDLIKAKLNQYPLELALKLADEYDESTKEIEQKYLKPEEIINKDALKVLNKVQYDVIKKRLKKEVN